MNNTVYRCLGRVFGFVPRFVGAAVLLLATSSSWSQTAANLTQTSATFTLSVPYLEYSGGTGKVALSARLTSNNLSVFALDTNAVTSVEVLGSAIDAATITSYSGGYRLSVPYFEYTSGGTTKAYGVNLVTSDLKTFSIEQQSVKEVTAHTIAIDQPFSSSCSNTPSRANVGPFAAQTGDCFFSYKISDAEQSEFLANGPAPVRLKLLNDVRTAFKDGVDAIVVLLDLDRDSSQAKSTSVAGVNFAVQGCSVHNPACPRFGRIGNVWMKTRNSLKNGPALHELLHGFHDGMTKNNTTDFIIPTAEPSHWGFSSAGGQLGGWDRNTFVSFGDGTYTAIGPPPPSWQIKKISFFLNASGGNTAPYSNLELWTMGLIPDAELQAIDVAEGAAFINPVLMYSADTPQTKFSATAIRTYSPIEIMGRINPSARPSVNSSRAFRALVVLASTNPSISPATVAQLNNDIENFTARSTPNSWEEGIYNFWTATGGRATIQMALASELANP